MEKIKYKEDEQGNKKVIIKTDPETDEVKVSCGCCECDGCGTLVGAVPPQGSSQTKPTSLAWSAAFSIEPRNVQCETWCTDDEGLSYICDTYDCGDPRELSGIITSDQQCSAYTGFVMRCYADEQQIEDNRGCPGGYRSGIGALIVIGKYRLEIQNASANCIGSYSTEVLVPDPEEPCAYWFILQGSERFGAQGGYVSYNGITGPVLPENIIGSHSLDCTVAAWSSCGGNITYLQRSGTITIS